MSKEGKTGVSANTPKNILFGAGTIHKGLKYTTNTWNFANSIVGATSGGSKLSIIPEVTKVEVDGALVAAKGLSVKTGETATMEINFIELTEDIIKSATLGQAGTSDDTNYNVIVPKQTSRKVTIGRTSPLSAKPWMAKTSLPSWKTPFALPALSRKARTRKALLASIPLNAMPN